MTPASKSETPRTNRLFDEELGRLVALDPHFKYFKRVREEMEKLERELSTARSMTFEDGYRAGVAVQDEMFKARKASCVEKCNHLDWFVCEYEDGTRHCLECVAEEYWRAMRQQARRKEPK